MQNAIKSSGKASQRKCSLIRSVTGESRFGASVHVAEESKSKDTEVREKTKHMLKKKTKEVQCGRTVCGEGRKVGNKPGQVDRAQRILVRVDSGLDEDCSNG